MAAAAGVSRMTVSNAYNRPDQLAPKTRQRVLEAAARLGYPGPDPTAASLRLGRTGTVGVVLTERLPYAFADPGLVTILHGIASELSDTGNALLLVPAQLADGQSLLRHAMVDALILCSLAAGDPAVAAARDRQVPLVTVGNPKLPKVPRIGPDNRRAAQGVARHLLDLGHRRFAVVTTVTDDRRGPSRPLFHERVDGFRSVLLDAGVPASDVTVICASDNSRSAGHEAATRLLDAPRSRRPTALFAVTDILALGVLDGAKEGGLEVPRELSVAGFDDIAAAQTSQPPLTTVAHDLFGQGRSAARLALRLIAGEQVRPPRTDTSLVVRESTGRPGRSVAR
ncbi:MAG TPA: LacI family DNA-binding transcriptional regulator [Jatrophihabitans sp.]|nr:LacI family DNA-binding transcriptional regulator [Jatrophihabitans sp.]